METDNRSLEFMLSELESHKLEVQLVPLNPKMRGWNEFGMKRVCVDVPPAWYRKFCALHVSSRRIRRGKFDTRIRRIDILRILSRLSEGKPSRSIYADELRRIASKLKIHAA
jgi:hypothetical protein